MGQQVVASGETPTQLGMGQSPEFDVEALPYLLLLIGVHGHLGYCIAGEHLIGMPQELVQEGVNLQCLQILVWLGLG